MDDTDRAQVLGELQEWLEKPMIALSFVWLVLLVVELAWGLNRALWSKVLALAAPALRVLRIARLARFARASRGLRLLRVVSSVNRAMRALGDAMPGGGFDSFATALWWTAMLVTTMGSEYWPKTPDGRVLCLALAVYGFAIFGYVTAALATYFIGRDRAALDEELERT